MSKHLSLSMLPAVLISMVLLACQSGATRLEKQPEADKAGNTSTAVTHTYVFECPKAYSFIARLQDSTAWLFLPDTTIAIPQVISDTGSKYAGEGYLFWVKGEEALLETGHSVYRNCRNNRFQASWEEAKLNGVDFRAMGNEPGWILEITAGKSLVFKSNYGSEIYIFDTPEAETDQDSSATIYESKTDDHAIRVYITPETCRDDMSGETYGSRVRIIFDEREYLGCGRALH